MQSFYLRDKYRDHMEEDNYIARCYTEGDHVKLGETSMHINLGSARNAWEV